jgi:hypothetical protein
MYMRASTGRRPLTSPLFRLAACLALLAQVVSACLAPTADARAERSAPAHVESGGTQLHHSHNPADCAACTALRLLGAPARPSAPRADIGAVHQALAAPSESRPRPLRAGGTNTPRAPPPLA